MLAAGSRALSLQLGGRNAQKAKMSQLTFNLQPTRQILTVSELTARIRDLLARNFTATFVQGEISNCREDRKSTRLNSSHGYISYAVFCLKKKTIARLTGMTDTISRIVRSLI